MCSTGLSNAVLSTGFCAFELPVEVNQVRSLISLGRSSILALERGSSSVLLLEDTNGDGMADTKASIATATYLTHGLALHDGYLYASSDNLVYRWRFSTGPAVTVGVTVVSGEPEIVITNINANGRGGTPLGHTTRTLIFDKAGRLYVSVGSADNIDADSFRSRLRRFNLSNATAFPIDYTQGEVFADGLRNEVGLAFDKHGVLWGVENGPDKLSRDDLGGDIHNGNPAEELNRLLEEDAGKHYGYPYCWSEYSLPTPPGLGPGTVWAWPSFLNATVTDDDCRTKYVPSQVAMAAHTAPLGITFYNYQPPEDLPEGCVGGFPETMDGYAFITMHGSWNSDTPVGYKVIYVAMDKNGTAVGAPVDLLKHVPPNAEWEDGFRPVDVAFDACGRLLVSSDGEKDLGYGGSKIVRIQSATEIVVDTTPPSQPNSLLSPTAPFAPPREEPITSSASSYNTGSPLLFLLVLYSACAVFLRK